MYKGFNDNFSKVVSDYFGKGYQIHAMTMSGHQGEIAKVDLYKGDTMIRIQLHYEIDDTVVLSVKQWNYPAFSGNTAWNSEFTTISTKIWYPVNLWSCNRNFAWYTESKEEALQCAAKHRKRAANRDVIKGVPLRGEAYQAIAKKYLKRQGITKRFTSTVEVAKYCHPHGYVKYRIHYKNKMYQLCAHHAA